jgi:hypothetical protein
MLRNLCLPALLLALAPLATQAQTFQTAYSFESIVGIMHNPGSYVSVSGIPEGEITPITVSVYWSGDEGLQGRCQTLINLALSEPAAYIYTLVIRTAEQPGPNGPETIDHLASCGLRRKP